MTAVPARDATPARRRSRRVLAGWGVSLLLAVPAAASLTQAAVLGVGAGTQPLVRVGLVGLLLAGLTATLPWDRLPRSASLVALLAAVAVAVGVDAAAETAGAHPVLRLSGAWTAAVLVWLAFAHGRTLAAGLALPLAAVQAVALADLGWSTATAAAMVHAGIGLGAAVLVSWWRDQGRESRRVATRRAALLEIVAKATRQRADAAPDAPLGAVMNATAELGFEAGALMVHGDADATLRVPVFQGDLPATLTTEPALDLLPSVAAAVMRGEVVVVDRDDPRHPDAVLAEAGYRVMAALPVRQGCDVTGALLVAAQSARGIEADELHALEVLAATAGRALEASVDGPTERRRVISLAGENRTDKLTGVGNRRAANEALTELNANDVVALLDLDHFKLVNDTMGHDVGDQVLAALAGHLRNGIRPGDVIARYGGEEFLIVLRGAGDEGIDGVRRLLETWRAQTPLTTFTAGVALHDGDRPVGDTVRRAHEALSGAKRAGRDRVVPLS